MIRRLATGAVALAGLAAQSGRGNEPCAGIDRTLAELTNVVVHEKIDRYCRAHGRVKKLDTFDATVEILDGTEQYSEVRRKDQLFPGVLQVGGLWSFGEIATLLRTTGDALRERADQADALQFRFPAASRRWFVTVDSRVYWLDFEGEAWISRGTGEVHRICWISAPLPVNSGVDRVHWTVDFQTVDIAGRTFNVPEEAVYQVTHPGGDRTEWNLTRFSDYARYGSSVSLSFGP